MNGVLLYTYFVYKTNNESTRDENVFNLVDLTFSENIFVGKIRRVIVYIEFYT